mgnify:CR=1 FL=1
MGDQDNVEVNPGTTNIISEQKSETETETASKQEQVQVQGPEQEMEPEQGPETEQKETKTKKPKYAIRTDTNGNTKIKNKSVDTIKDFFIKKSNVTDGEGESIRFSKIFKFLNVYKNIQENLLKKKKIINYFQNNSADADNREDLQNIINKFFNCHNWKILITPHICINTK